MSEVENTIRHRRASHFYPGEDEEYNVDGHVPGNLVPRTCIVLRITSTAKPEAVRWLIEKIGGLRSEGGAELVIHQQAPRKKGHDLILHISASKIKLLEAAEQLELQKQDRDGRLRDFAVVNLEEFLLDESMTVDELLTTAEKQRIVRHELENIRAQEKETYVPGYACYSLYQGQSVLQVFLENNIIAQIYPLHDDEELKKLSHFWYKSILKNQPIEQIRLYFGEAIALYCTFLGFYTTALLIPMCFGFIQLVASSETVPYFCVLNVVWTVVFLEMWKRKSNELAFKWGTIGMTSLDEPRANYHGQMGIDPVSGKIGPQYRRWKTNAKMYLVSLPIVVICMIFAFIVMLASFYCEEWMKNYESEYKSTLVQLPSIIYSVLVFIMNVQYRWLATTLTEWENHRTQSQFDRHRVTKLVLFEFVNNFMSLFYIAFIIQDMDMLRNQIAVMLIIQQALNNVQEAILPLIVRVYMQKYSALKEKMTTLSKSSKFSILEDVPTLLESDDPQGLCQTAETEGDMEIYEGTFDDYLEMYIQFGYVVLFSSVYPAAAFWAVINNLIEIRTDAFRLCKVYQRPIAKRVKDIGAWQRAFEIVGALSIMTNCGLLALSPTMRASFGVQGSSNIVPSVSDGEISDAISEISEVSLVTWILAFVFIEHLLLGFRFILHKAIPERPEWVRVELAKRAYESRRALKNEKKVNNRQILTRRFKTVHGPHQHNTVPRKSLA